MNKCRRKSVGYLSGCSPRILAWRGISSYCYGRTILVYSLFGFLETLNETRMENGTTSGIVLLLPSTSHPGSTKKNPVGFIVGPHCPWIPQVRLDPLWWGIEDSHLESTNCILNSVDQHREFAEIQLQVDRFYPIQRRPFSF
jgi:hypothetical protein